MHGNRYYAMVEELLITQLGTLAEIDSILSVYPELGELPDVACLADVLSELGRELEEQARALLMVEGAKAEYRVKRALGLWMQEKAQELHGVVVLSAEAPASGASSGAG